MMKELQHKSKWQVCLKDALVFANNQLQRADVRIVNGVVTAIGSVEPEVGEAVWHLNGALVMPGMADVHVHLREPGFSYKETIGTGTMAAAAGGYTLVCSMPNLNPAPDSVAHVAEQLKLIEEHAVIQVVPYGCITKGQKGEGELVDFASIQADVCGFSDDGRGVQADALMGEVMRELKDLGGMVVAHCEVNELLKGGYIHDGEYAKLHHHKGICSESEWQQVQRDIELARATGCAYHVCHISTKETVELVRQAKAEGLNVTCETAPHYLLLTDMDLQEDGCYKMNPPLRSADDRDALIAGVADCTIEMIATDHAPHSAEEKSKGLAGSYFGIVGLETAFPLLYTHLVLKGVISLEKLIELMVVAPRKRFGYEVELKVGEEANLTIKDLEIAYKIDSSQFLSMGKAMPFEGWEVKGRNLATVYQGVLIYQDEMK